MRRRRGYHRRPKPIVREHPAVVELVGNPLRPGPVIVPIGNDRYAFHELGDGRTVAMVAREDHIACFASRPEMYRVQG